MHNRDEAIQAVRQARSIGFANINIDIMFGLPGQTSAQAQADLHQALDLTPTHLSWYQLTIEPNTAFAITPPVLPADDAIAEIQYAGCELLAQHGYQQYEVSAYAQTNRQCRHNLNYWEYGDYLGVGAGAHGKLTATDPFTITRTTRAKHPNSRRENSIRCHSRLSRQ